MLYSIERKTLFTFCLAVTLAMLLCWASLEYSPRSTSMTAVTARVRECLASLQQARRGLTQAELVDQAYRTTGDSRLRPMKQDALADAAAALLRHDRLSSKLTGIDRPEAIDLRGMDAPDIRRIIDVRDADDTDFLSATASRWEQNTVRYNATVLLSGSICLISMIGALCVALLREVALRRERDTVDAQARERLTDIMDTLPIAFLSVDEKLRVTYANREACRILRHEPEDAHGRALPALLPPSLAQHFEAHATEVLSTLAPRQFETLEAEQDRWLAVEVSPSPYGISVHMRDITETRRAMETQERLLALLEATPDVVGIQDYHGNCYFNRAGRELFGVGHSPKELGTPAALLSDPLEVDVPEDIFPIGLERGIYRSEKLIAASDGRQVPVSQVAIGHRDRNGEIAFVSTILRDISVRKRVESELQEQVRLVESYSRQLESANERLQALATTDGLTGLKNHRAFQEQLSDEFHRAARYRRPLSVVLIDVDFFKQYNDSFGHPAGDQVLKRIAAALRSASRSTDTVARYGGEEFVVILSETDSDGAMEAAERMRRAVEEAGWPGRPVTVSVGVASLEPDTETPADLVESADQALYWSKSSGKNRVTHDSSLGGAAGHAAGRAVVCRLAS